MKTYLEIKVPISYNSPWFNELREVLSDLPVYWQKGYYHITMAFIDETVKLSQIEEIMHKSLNSAEAVTITFDKLDVFTTNTGMHIVNLSTTNIPESFNKLVEKIRYEICGTGSAILSDFRLHVTLGRITNHEVDVDDIGFLIDDIQFAPFTLTLNEVEYREFRGRSIYRNTLATPMPKAR